MIKTSPRHKENPGKILHNTPHLQEAIGTWVVGFDRVLNNASQVSEDALWILCHKVFPQLQCVRH